MENRLRCARQREQVMATGFEKDESLLRDSEDWRSKMRLSLKPRNQPGFLKARQPPTKRPRTFSDDFEATTNRTTDQNRLPAHSGHATGPARRVHLRVRYGPCNTSLERSFANIVQAGFGIRTDRPAIVPRSLSTQSSFPNSNIASYLSPRKTDRDGTDAGRLPTRFGELDCAMLRGFERDQVGVWHHLCGAALE